MSTATDVLVPHLEAAALALANSLSFTTVHAGNLVPVDDPTPALPLGDLRLVRAAVAPDVGLEVVLALVELEAVRAVEAIGAAGPDGGGDELVSAVLPALLAAVGELADLSGLPLDVSQVAEVPVGSPWGPPGTTAATAGLFEADEQIGNVVFLFVPEGADGVVGGAGDGSVVTSAVVAGFEGSTVAPAEFPDADADADEPEPHPLSMLRGVEMKVTAELGRARLPVSHLLDLGPGSVVELDRVAGTPVDVLVNGTVIAHGEVVVIDEEYGVRITEIVGLDEA